MRRIHFDLIGFPSSPEQIEDFLADSDPDAFSKVVDGLLASVSFGERWGGIGWMSDMPTLLEEEETNPSPMPLL